LYGNRVRFAHRSFQEFLAALSYFFDMQDEPTSDTDRVPALMLELDELGDDREVSRFFAGLMLRGTSDWERRLSQSIIQHRLPSGQAEDRQHDSTWVLRLLGDVGYGSRDCAGIVQHFFGHKMQREMKGIISEIGNARRSEIPELLDVFFRAQPRNSYLLFHAVEQLEALRAAAATVLPSARSRTTQYVKAAERSLAGLWRESARFGPPVPASALKEFAAQWNGSQCVPAPNMIRIPEGDVVLSNGRSVKVSAFYAAETLVTKAQFAAMTGRPITPDDLRMPYTHATWYDAMMFAHWALGGVGTLPTRTQWIRMARGSSLNEFPWGAESDAISVNALANTAQLDRPGPTPVDHFRPQGVFKLYDLGGNLLEWTDTWFDPDELSGGVFEPEPEHGYARLLMGGSYAHIVAKARCAFPFPSSPENYVDVIGARIAVAEDDYIQWKDRG
jgi:formylglycine-generating enzyme required for sulfatase activity